MGAAGAVLAGIVVDGSARIRLGGRGPRLAFLGLLVAASLPIIATLVVREAGWLPALTTSRVVNAAAVGFLLVTLHARARRARTQGGGANASPDPTSLPLRAAGARWLGVLIVVGALECVGVSLVYLGFEVGPTWLISLTSSFGPIIAIVAGVALLAERPHRLQWLGVAMVFASSGLLAVG